jgi:ComF family protein
MWMIAKVFHFLGNIFFPPRCIGCDKQETTLCGQCLSRSRKSLTVPRPFIISHYSFKEPVIRRSIHAIKYYHRRDLIPPLVLPLQKQLLLLPNVEKYVLVPVPMPRIRKLMRGYNQAELIARELGKALSLPIRTDILERARSGPRQVEAKTRSERMKNQRGLFRIKESPGDMRILLVDDVVTTGATLEEARKVLLSKGARNVHAVTIAH